MYFCLDAVMLRCPFDHNANREIIALANIIFMWLLWFCYFLSVFKFLIMCALIEKMRSIPPVVTYEMPRILLFLIFKKIQNVIVGFSFAVCAALNERREQRIVL